MKLEDIGGRLALKDPQEKFDIPVVKLPVDGVWISKHTSWKAAFVLFKWSRVARQHAVLSVGVAVSKARLSHLRPTLEVLVGRVCFHQFLS